MKIFLKVPKEIRHTMTLNFLAAREICSSGELPDNRSYDLSSDG